MNQNNVDEMTQVEGRQIQIAQKSKQWNYYFFYALHKHKVSKLEQSRMFNEQNHVAFVIVCVTWTCNYGVLKDVAELVGLDWNGMEKV